MGSLADPFAVVDPETRVIGVDALRVVDCQSCLQSPHCTAPRSCWLKKQRT
jgi:choline dehydrogenase-like flavoprotein